MATPVPADLPDQMASALAARDAEIRMLTARQAASTEVLKAISASPDDPQPVFELIARHARVLCDAQAVVVLEYDGALLHHRAIEGHEAAAVAQLRKAFPRPAGADTMAGRAVLAGRVVRVRDLSTEPGMFKAGRGLGARTSFCVPLLRDSRPIGAILLSRFEVREFDDAHVALVKSFAEQAVIAIASASTRGELRTRTGDLQEALGYQTATSDVLKVMSRSTFDLQPVLDTLVETAARLCHAEQAVIFRREGELYRLAANFGYPAEYEAYYKRHGAFPIDPKAVNVGMRTAHEGRVVHIHDVASVPDYPEFSIRLGKQRTTLGVPLLREGETVGIILLARQRVEPFTDRQIELVRTFADQAAIAMENARLLGELQARTRDLQESLDYQTATSDVLKVISGSAFDLDSVLRAVVSSAGNLCRADRTILYRYRDGACHYQTASNILPEYEALERASPIGPGRATLVGRVMLERRRIEIADALQDREYGPKDQVAIGGVRSMLGVPLLRDGALVGVFALARVVVEPFSERQIELVTTFADQAAIAMENARLLGELQARTLDLQARTGDLQESLEFQTATSDVLKVISRSTFDLDPVFQAVLLTAVKLCRADQATIYRFQDGEYRWAAGYSLTPAYERIEREVRIRPGTGTLVGRAALEGRTVQILDPQEDPLYEAKEDARIGGVRTMLGVPLLRDGVAIGVFGLARRRVEPYTERQIELVNTFAAQAVIAIENTRLLTEQQEALDQQTATAEVLQVINASPGNLAPVFEAMIDRALRLSGAQFGGFLRYDGALFHTFADRASFVTAGQPLRPEAALAQLVAGENLIHVADVRDSEEYRARIPGRVRLVEQEGARTGLWVALRKDRDLLGALLMWRKEVRPFSEKQIALLQSFAAQAVIAMENARLLSELQDRTAELTRSVAELQALEEVLRAVNSSLDLETVLATVIDRAVRLGQADEGMIYEFDTIEKVFVPKASSGMTEDRIARLRDRRIRIGETFLGRSALERAPVHVENVQHDPSTPEAKDLLQGIHAVLAVPLLREDAVVGGLVIRRRSEGAFAPATVTLMRTFAAQCVLAIENARLFDDSRRTRAAAEAALADLHRAQDRLVQAEKMASLGQLTAGIAHEIKNPLNFINNFSDLSVELLDELQAALAPASLAVAAEVRAEIDDLSNTLKDNLRKITEHGRRADGIVRNMLLHSRSGPVENRSVELNAVCEEALNLAYHGARANTPGFNITLQTDFDPAAGTVEMFPQDFMRALLNLIGNGFYAAGKRAERVAGFEPTLLLSTRDLGDRVEIRVRDNGTGIAADLREKIFDPFFTTKPAGEGTGLGLSLTFDIVVKQHGGQLRVASQPDAFTEFAVILPRATPGGVQDRETR